MRSSGAAQVAGAGEAGASGACVGGCGGAGAGVRSTAGQGLGPGLKNQHRWGGRRKSQHLETPARASPWWLRWGGAPRFVEALPHKQNTKRGFGRTRQRLAIIHGGAGGGTSDKSWRAPFHEALHVTSWVPVEGPGCASTGLHKFCLGNRRNLA